jgi:Uma2 family endonuclease
MAMRQQRDAERARLVALLGGDREDSPWMVSTEIHLHVVIDLLQALQRALARRLGTWHVGGEVFVVFGPGEDDKLAPDVYAAPVADYPRDTFDVAAEGLFPPFVVEVVSESSRRRDLEDKVALYDVLGAEEYVVIDVTGRGRTGRRRGRSVAQGGVPELWGYRREQNGEFASWVPDAQGRLWSAVLGLGLLAEGQRVRVLTAQGEAVPFTDELEDEGRRADEARAQEAAARQRAEEERQREATARRHAEEERQQEAAARQRAEEEVARLRAELARLRVAGQE